MMDIARATLLDEVLNKSQELLEGLTDLRISDSIRDELSEALAPFLETMCMLPYQRWQYTFDMVRAVDEEDWIPLDPAEMEGQFGEGTGWVKASLFPQLCRIQYDGPDEVSSMKGLMAGSHLNFSRFCAVQSSTRPESQSNKTRPTRLKKTRT
jgi:hypothetical protein